MSARQRYRFVAPSTGREVIVEALEGHTYRDRETNEVLQPLGKLVPLAPSSSNLPWSLENLRHCPLCDQMTAMDANDCGTCGRRMPPIEAAV